MQLLRSVLFALIVCTLQPLTVVAFAQANDAVPRELALALLRGPGDGIRLLVGKTPERFPFELAPTNATLLGALQRDRMSTVVYVSKLDAEAARSAWEQQMTASSWTKPAAYSQRANNGFVTSSSPGAVPVFCSNGMLASLTSNVRFEGGSTLLLQYSDSSMQTLCTAGRASEVNGPFVVTPDTMPVPALLPPSGVNVVSYSGSSTVDTWEQQARISGSMPVVALLGHYSEQLTKAGWSAGAVASTEGMAAQTFRIRLPGSGFEVVSTIVIVANPFDATNQNARMNVYRRR